ncbi:Cytochrome P [Parasponia andersonii]|uniref:Cytochrome P n=1 Tax=Parasponia andersonii TaxID=3476 RepID=A0A2P5A9Q9_PARAD|nr:Cytochrome P [Parasponia andersonii]
MQVVLHRTPRDHGQLADVDHDCLVYASQLARKGKRGGSSAVRKGNTWFKHHQSPQDCKLYPPVTLLFRYTKQETNIGGMSIPAGVETVLFILSLHHDPKHWGHDATEFNPERFSEGVAKSSKDDQMAFYPFGWGPRIYM